MMLKNFLTPEARERLSRVALVKPDNARAVEEHIIRLGRSGKLSAQVRTPEGWQRNARVCVRIIVPVCVWSRPTIWQP